MIEVKFVIQGGSTLGIHPVKFLMDKHRKL